MAKIEETIQKIPEEWFDYEPLDDLYGVYDANIIVSLHKIADVFDNYCRARMLLLEVDNVPTKGREIDILYLKSALVLSALMHYATCMDLSCQVVWFRYFEGHNPRLINDKKYLNKRLHACNLKKLVPKMKNSSDEKVKKIYELININFHKDAWKKLREMNNYYKHNGALHVDGIGLNPKKSILALGDKSLNVLSREEFDMHDWINQLSKFNDEFIAYFNKIIEYAIPNDYYEQRAMDIAFFEKLKQYVIE